MSPIRVLIADDHRLFAEALELTLHADPRVEVVGHACDGREAVELAAALGSDVILMDLDMPVLDGIEATREVSRSARVAMLTASPAPEDAVRAREAGAAAYLTKGCAADEVLDAVLELATPADPRRKEVTRGERGVREAFAGLPRDLLQFRARLAH